MPGKIWFGYSRDVQRKKWGSKLWNKNRSLNDEFHACSVVSASKYPSKLSERGPTTSSFFLLNN